MQRVKQGDFITVEYQGTLDNGEIFETTNDSGALEFQMGEGAVLPAFEQALFDMTPEETRSVSIKAGEAYGERLAELVQTLDRQTIGAQKDIKPGMIIGMTIEHEGKTEKVPALVTEVTDSQVTVDFNHPLAGQNLNYTITLKAIQKRTAE